MSGKHPSLTYRDAGVDIDAGDALVERIKPYAKRTMRPEVLVGIGGFGALVEVSKKYREPVMVSGTDGVGTKLKLAFRMKKHDTIGIDLVAMSVNDILVSGAEPVFFLDYFACGQLNVDVAADVVKGVALGCEQAGCALIGGETAEMPGMYDPNEYDLAGFAVGLVEKGAIITGDTIVAGDAVIGLASSGLHSNGYSLVRKVVATIGADLHENFDGRTLGAALLEPTRIYVKPVLELIAKATVKGIAHITGGGLTENVPRVLPEPRVPGSRRSAGRAPRSSTGCSARAASRKRKWCAPLIAASGWPSWCPGVKRRPRSSRSPRRAFRLTRSDRSLHGKPAHRRLPLSEVHPIKMGTPA